MYKVHLYGGNPLLYIMNDSIVPFISWQVVVGGKGEADPDMLRENGATIYSTEHAPRVVSSAQRVSSIMVKWGRQWVKSEVTVEAPEWI